MHPELKTVIELQQLDQKIAELNEQIESLPAEIQKLESQLNDFIHAHQDRQQPGDHEGNIGGMEDHDRVGEPAVAGGDHLVREDPIVEVAVPLEPAFLPR